MFRYTPKLIIIIYFILVLAACQNSSVEYNSSINSNNGEKSVNAKIIDGTEQSQLSSPQILKINIVYSDQTSAFCTGTVIGNNSILTAGHCFSDGNIPKETTATYVTKPDGIILTAGQIFVHPGFQYDISLGAIFNDLAIVRTTENLNLPVLSILASRQLEAGTLVGIYGYGLDENGSAGYLRSGNMIIDSVTPNHLISTYNEYSNPCNGDSGGPVTYSLPDQNGNVVSVAIAGIISSGSVENCERGDVNLFTNLGNPSIINFISDLVPEVSLQ